MFMTGCVILVMSSCHDKDNVKFALKMLQVVTNMHQKASC